ncbi:Nn.00g070500.m01.CDS01 [Neocucurbitaria sp. VM-36]
MSSMQLAAKVVGLTGAAWLSGNIAALSFISVPAVVRGREGGAITYASAVEVWKKMYEAGKAQNPPIALGCATSFAFLAWTSRSLQGMSSGRNSKLFALAAFMTIGIVPYTIAVMKPTNDKLMQFATKTKKTELSATDQESIDAILQQWTFLNTLRSAFPLAGAAIASVAIMA